MSAKLEKTSPLRPEPPGEAGPQDDGAEDRAGPQAIQAMARDPMVPDVLAAACPSREYLGHVTSRWGVLVLLALLFEKRLRFSALRRRIGRVSERMLAQTLKTLERDGFVLRQAFDVVPPHVEYSLTPLGREVAERVGELAGWIEANLGRLLAARADSAEQTGAKDS